MTLSMLLFGFLLGVRHSLEADHIAAVAAMSTRASSPREMLRLALSWGTGHMLTIVVVGGLAIAVGLEVSPSAAGCFDRLIGFVLIVLGMDVLWRVRARRVHAHAHAHDGGRDHLHLHFHDRHPGHAHAHGEGVAGRALAMGMLHGMGGTAALMLLVAPRAASPAVALGSLALCGLGSIAGMVLFSAALSVPLRGVARFATTLAALEGGLGLATVAVGARLLAG